SGCSGCLHVKSGSQFPVLESNLVHGNEISLSCESEVYTHGTSDTSCSSR
uniref:Uncharacterized protein n=1 Tax=Oryza glaberrima TaxID=4538 RepID=I1QW90_ORYGL